MRIRWDRGSRAMFPYDQRIKGLITSRLKKYKQHYDLDYCGNFTDILASGILVSYWRRPNSYYFGDRRDCDRSQARHRSRSIGVRLRLGV